MSVEAKLIAAICKNKDIASVIPEDVDHMFEAYSDVWEELRNYYMKYRSVPDLEVIRDKFDDVHFPSEVGDTMFHLEELRDHTLNQSIREMMRSASKEYGKISAKEMIERLQREVSKLSKDANIVRDVDLTDVDDAISDYEERKRRRLEMGGTIGIPTGLKVIDTFYSTGLAPGHMAVIIGWSGYGKSLFSALLACNAWNEGFSPMIVSLEMTPEEIRDRVYTIMGSGLFSNKEMMRGELDIDKFGQWAKVELDGKPRFTIISNEGVSEVTPNVIQAKVDQYKPDMVIVDYSQLLSDNNGNSSEVQRNRNVSRDLKQLAMRNNIPVVNLSQATQESPSDLQEPPRISQVAWSKGIQHDADVAIAVHKLDDCDEFIIVGRKNRHGELFEFVLEWDIDRGIIKESV